MRPDTDNVRKLKLFFDALDAHALVITPYQGDDLVYDAVEPDRFLVRCSRNGAGPTPGICLYERRIEAADVVVRFPRDWLNDWRLVAGGIERLIRSLRPLPS
jgi:hypothetical protein